MNERLDVGALLRQLHESEIEHVLIGGLAVNAWGVIRSTKDIDICPSPEPKNLERLAALLRHLGVRQLGVGIERFAEPEMPFDPTSPDDLAEGGNFRLATPLGVLDIMQCVPGIDADNTYAALAADAKPATAFGIEIKVCSLDALRLMKRAAGRPQDLPISIAPTPGADDGSFKGQLAATPDPVQCLRSVHETWQPRRGDFLML